MFKSLFYFSERDANPAKHRASVVRSVTWPCCYSRHLLGVQVRAPAVEPDTGDNCFLSFHVYLYFGNFGYIICFWSITVFVRPARLTFILLFLRHVNSWSNNQDRVSPSYWFHLVKAFFIALPLRFKGSSSRDYGLMGRSLLVSSRNKILRFKYDLYDYMKGCVWKKSLKWLLISSQILVSSVKGSEKQCATRILLSIRCHLGSFSMHPFIWRLANKIGYFTVVANLTQ